MTSVYTITKKNKYRGTLIHTVVLEDPVRIISSFLSTLISFFPLYSEMVPVTLMKSPFWIDMLRASAPAVLGTKTFKTSELQSTCNIRCSPLWVKLLLRTSASRDTLSPEADSWVYCLAPPESCPAPASSDPKHRYAVKRDDNVTIMSQIIIPPRLSLPFPYFITYFAGLESACN
jgi:hypothetical protein